MSPIYCFLRPVCHLGPSRVAWLLASLLSFGCNLLARGEGECTWCFFWHACPLSSQFCGLPTCSNKYAPKTFLFLPSLFLSRTSALHYRSLSSPSLSPSRISAVCFLLLSLPPSLPPSLLPSFFSITFSYCQNSSSKTFPLPLPFPSIAPVNHNVFIQTMSAVYPNLPT